MPGRSDPRPCPTIDSESYVAVTWASLTPDRSNAHGRYRAAMLWLAVILRIPERETGANRTLNMSQFKSQHAGLRAPPCFTRRGSDFLNKRVPERRHSRQDCGRSTVSTGKPRRAHVLANVATRGATQRVIPTRACAHGHTLRGTWRRLCSTDFACH